MKKVTAFVLALLLALALCPVSVLAMEVDVAPPSDVAPPFDDIQDQPNRDAILWCYEKGYLKGTGGGHFSPEGEVTRAMAAAVLFRDAGAVEGPMPFKDVPLNAWYSAPVWWAASHGWINGTGEGLFSPDRVVARQDFALMLRRMACCDGVDTDVSFAADGEDVASYARDAAAWAYRQGILRLDGEKRLRPQDPVTRSELASMIKAFYGEAETQFDLDPDQITSLTIRTTDGRDNVNATPEQIRWIADWLNQFPVLEKAEIINPDITCGYYMDFVTTNPENQRIRVIPCNDQSLYMEDFDQKVFYYGRPLTGLIRYLDQCFEDVPFVDPEPVQLLDVKPEDVDAITIREFTTGAQAEITAPEDIAKAAQTLSQVEGCPCKELILPECWDYIFEISSQKEELDGTFLRLCRGADIVLGQNGLASAAYSPSGDTDAALWELAEQTLHPIPDKVDKLFDIDPKQVEKLEIRSGGGELVTIAGQSEIAKLARALNRFGYVEENAGHDAVGYQYYIDFTSGSQELNGLRVTVISKDCLLVSRPGQDETVTEYLSPGYAAGLLELLDQYFQPLPDKGTPPEA